MNWMTDEMKEVRDMLSNPMIIYPNRKILRHRFNTKGQARSRNLLLGQMVLRCHRL